MKAVHFGCTGTEFGYFHSHYDSLFQSIRNRYDSYKPQLPSIMSYESVNDSLKKIGKMMDDLKYGFRTLKSTKEVNRRRTIQTILERADALRENVQPLAELLDDLIADCEKQIDIAPPATSSLGVPYATTLEELGLSKRACNGLRSINVSTLGELAGLEFTDLFRIKGFGRISLTEVEEALDKAGVQL